MWDFFRGFHVWTAILGSKIIKSLDPSRKFFILFPNIALVAILGYLKGGKIFIFFNFYYVFPIYNSMLHDICSTSNQQEGNDETYQKQNHATTFKLVLSTELST